MKDAKTLHFWRIHGRVARRIWTDLPLYVRNIIAADSEHVTPEFQWFNQKTNEDAERLFQDESYYDNDPWTFRTSKREDEWSPYGA